MWGCRDAGLLGCKDAGVQGHRDAGMQGCRVLELLARGSGEVLAGLCSLMGRQRGPLSTGWLPGSQSWQGKVGKQEREPRSSSPRGELWLSAGGL